MKANVRFVAPRFLPRYMKRTGLSRFFSVKGVVIKGEIRQPRGMVKRIMRG